MKTSGPKFLVVLGGKESGTGAAILGKRTGHRVLVSDAGSIQESYREMLKAEEIEFEEGGHSQGMILSADLVVKSPGIPDSSSLVVALRSKGIPVISEIEFAGRFTRAFKICISGSNGKTTTTLLTYHILRKAGLEVVLAGNVGKSFALQVAENLDREVACYVIELSSFQLDGMYDFKAEMAVLTNITPDHLDRYDYDFQKYIDSKFRILQNQTDEDYFIFCDDDEVIQREIQKREVPAMKLPFTLGQPSVSGAGRIGEDLVVNFPPNTFVMPMNELALTGKHNAYNSMAAALAANVLQIRKSVIRESLADFQGVEHRLEPVIRVRGVLYINDSKATNINSTWYALESMTDPVVWIVGGTDKGNDYNSLLDLVKEKVRAIVCLGVDNSRIHAAFDHLGLPTADCLSAREAVQAAYRFSRPGDTVLLSPACASFDLFQNYEDRGRQFKNEVFQL